MPPAAIVMAQQVKSTQMLQAQKPMVMPTEAFAKDAILAWFRGEFAAANAIIDALCGHLTQLDGGGKEYDLTFAAIHKRRLNWIPILQMQKYYSIAEVTMELNKVSERRSVESGKEERVEEILDSGEKDEQVDGNLEVNDQEEGNEENLENSMESNENGGKVVEEDLVSVITDSGSQEVQPSPENILICSNHEECEERRAQFKITKGFVAKERVQGHNVNVVRGLKLFEDVFTNIELSKLNDFVNKLRVAGQNGELSGETFISYNQQKNKRELIQLGVPIFGQIRKGEDKDCIEPIPALLQDIIDHLIQWRLIPQSRKPNSCIINFFDEGEYSQPFSKPPHLEQPLSTILLSESTMAFGHKLESDGEGNYRGPLMLSLNEGSLLVMRANSSDTARHVMCASSNKRASITFFKVQAEVATVTTDPPSEEMTLCGPADLMPNMYEQMSMIPQWGIIRAPVVMLASQVPPLAMDNPGSVQRDGTGVFLPWNIASRKHVKHLPPRAQRGRLSELEANSP